MIGTPKNSIVNWFIIFIIIKLILYMSSLINDKLTFARTKTHHFFRPLQRTGMFASIILELLQSSHSLSSKYMLLQKSV